MNAIELVRNALLMNIKKSIYTVYFTDANTSDGYIVNRPSVTCAAGQSIILPSLTDTTKTYSYGVTWKYTNGIVVGREGISFTPNSDVTLVGYFTIGGTI